MTTQLTAIQPFGYQLDAVDAVERAFVEGQNALMVAASGTGKGIMSGLVVQNHVAEGRWLALCHDNSILERLMVEHRKVLGDQVTMGLFHGQEREYGEVDILYASFQTMRDWRNAFFFNEFVGMVVDESHHGEARTFKETIEYFDVRYRLGMTATPDRMDGKDIRTIFGSEVVDLPLELAIGQGWLTPVEYHVVTDGLSTIRLKQILDDVLGGKHVSIKQLNETIFVEKRDEEIAKIILDSDDQTVIFCENILHIRSFQPFLPGSGAYHSKQNTDKNKEVLEGFERGDLQFILAVNKFNEGIHVPKAKRIVFLRCTDSTTIFLQQLGRGLSKGDSDKDKVVVLDFVANADRLLMIRDVVGRIRHQDWNILDRELFEGILHISGQGFDFIFTDEQLDVFDIIDRIKRRYISDVPLLLAEYSPENPLSPDQVIAGTGMKLLWVCSTCGHKWPAAGSHRIGSRHRRGTSCPSCSGRASPTNNLTVTHPKLAKEYMPQPSNDLPVEQIAAGHNKSVQWKCSVSTCGHTWKTLVSNRTRNGHGCPACSGRVATLVNNLAFVRPDIAKEYLPPPENNLPANQITSASNIRAKWMCSICGHKWETTPGHRTVEGTGCPSCSGNEVTPTNNFAARYPDLAKEYISPTAKEKNKNKLPADKVMPGFTGKVWWRYQCGHRAQQRMDHRIAGSNCAICAGYGSNLAAVCPALAVQYMPPPTNRLRADQIGPGSKEIVRWRCEQCEHEWETSVASRLGGFKKTGKFSGCRPCSYKERGAKRRNAES